MYISDTIEIPTRLILNGSIVSVVLKCTPTLKDILILEELTTDNIFDFMFVMFQNNIIDGQRMLRSEFDTIENKEVFANEFIDAIKKKAMSAGAYIASMEGKTATATVGGE